MIDHDSASPTDNWNRMTSRDGVLELPHMMAMLAYVSKTHGLPRYGWLDKRTRYHYTNAAGLIGILTSHRLWATDIRFLNDSSEGAFLPSRLLSLMQKNSGRLLDREMNLIDGIRRALERPARDKSSIFSISLCADGDLLSQWRGYGSFGAGYAVGLDSWPHFQLGSFYDVHYGEANLDTVASDLLDIYVRSVDKWGIDTISEEAASLFRILASSFKDPSFSEEKETRIVVNYAKSEKYQFQNEAPLHFRARGADVIPYVPLAFYLMQDADLVPKLPIKKIVIGPGVEYERNFHSITHLLEENGYEGVEIVRSAIPFQF